MDITLGKEGGGSFVQSKIEERIVKALKFWVDLTSVAYLSTFPPSFRVSFFFRFTYTVNPLLSPHPPLK